MRRLRNHHLYKQAGLFGSAIGLLGKGKSLLSQGPLGKVNYSPSNILKGKMGKIGTGLTVASGLGDMTKAHSNAMQTGTQVTKSVFS